MVFQGLEVIQSWQFMDFYDDENLLSNVIVEDQQKNTVALKEGIYPLLPGSLSKCALLWTHTTSVIIPEGS